MSISESLSPSCSFILLKAERKFASFSLTVLFQAYKETDEIDVARRLAAQRKKRYLNIDEKKAKKRVGDFLLRRGFGWDIVNEVMDDWDEIQ